MRTIFVIRVIQTCRNGRRKKIKYVSGSYRALFSADINLAEILYTDSAADQVCATWRENHPQHKFDVFAVNIVINQNYDPYN